MGIRERVREVFLEPQPAYSLEAAAELLGCTEAELTRAIAAGEVETSPEEAGLIEWQEVAAVLTSQYPQTLIEQALGAQADSVIPELVRLSELHVLVPRYQTAMLRHLAEREHVSIDEFVAQHFLDLASAECDWLSKRMPGFGEALRWPQL